MEIKYSPVLKKKVAIYDEREWKKVKAEEKIDIAAAAIRDMFLSKQYKNNVPVEDIEKIRFGVGACKSWFDMYGKANVLRAWRDLVKEGIIALRPHDKRHYYLPFYFTQVGGKEVCER